MSGRLLVFHLTATLMYSYNMVIECTQNTTATFFIAMLHDATVMIQTRLHLPREI